jgi:predicted RND superfamily exporter protein
MHRISTVLAGWIVRKPFAVAAGGLLLGLVSTWIIFSRSSFDSDILNLLPSDDPAVQGLKIFNSEFTQTRELAFLLDWPVPPSDLEPYRDAFLARLRGQPWMQRVLDAPPLETIGGRETIHEILVPLLLNLPPDQFAAALEDLSPQAIHTRIARLAAQTSAGSPKARFQLENDPLGLAARAAKPVWESVSISETFNLTSPDGTAMIIPVITNQPDLSAPACVAIMNEVRHFIQDRASEFGPGGPRIGVTGRSAYVEEIEQSMQRDIALTSLVSLLCVTGLFWLGFRRLFPLIGIAVLLGLMAVAAMAAGALYFNKLNIIAVSFCSILFGLGDDFSLLLLQRFFQCRNAGNDRETSIANSIDHCAPGFLWVAFTTGIGFLALCFSGSSGFAQLGVLVALGVWLCAVLMPVFLFLFVGKAPSATASEGPMHAFVGMCVQSPGRMLAGATLFFMIPVILSLLPWRSIHFDISPASLEPRNIPAAKTLALMMKKFPATFEPVMIVLPHPDAQQLATLDDVLKDLKSQRLIETSSSPSALVLDGPRMRANGEIAHQRDLAASRAALEQALAAADVSREPFKETFNVLDGLQRRLPDDINWSSFLSTSSPWWFLFDRMISPTSGAVIAYARTSDKITGSERDRIEAIVTTALPEALVTGWSQALASLTAWASRELVLFGGAVSVVILLVLGIVYRNARFWLLHAISLLASAAGTIATLKFFEVPINLLNVLAFPLILGVGVDYGTHIILAAKEEGTLSDVAGVLKPIALSGLTTATGFGSLMLAQNPALSGLGTICAIGVGWCLLASLLVVTPGVLILRSKQSPRTRAGTSPRLAPPPSCG